MTKHLPKTHHRKYAHVTLSLIVCLLFLYSCDGNFLDGQPLDQVSDQDIWQDITLTESFVNNIYGNMRTGHSGDMSVAISSDEAYGREETGAFLIQRGDVNPSDLGQLDWTWDHYFEIIASCNTFLTNVSGDIREGLAAQDEDLLDRMTGEVKVLRAFAYHRLSSFFGSVPLITSALSLEDDLMVERTPYDEVVDFIVDELDEAISLLPPSYPDSESGRITEGAAMAVKSRVLLYAASPLHNQGNNQQEWQAASDAAKAVIDLNRYSLYPDYQELFTEEGNFNNEVIWELVIDNDQWGRFNLELCKFPNGDGGWACSVPTQNQVDAYQTTDGLMPEEDPDYDPQDPWADRDPRFYASILYDGAPWRDREIEVFRPGGADSPDGDVSPHNASHTGYYTRKFADEEWDRPLGESSSPNWIMVRYAEMLLNYAEAEYHLGNEDEARDYINMVRSRPSVDMPDVTVSGPDLLERIKNERRVELFLEEHRFFDIRRWQQEFPETDSVRRVHVQLDTDTGDKTISYSGVHEWALPEHTYLLPIPLSEMQANPDLEQNPGY